MRHNYPGPYFIHIINRLHFVFFQVRQRLDPFFRQLAERRRNFFLKKTKRMKKPQGNQEKNASKSIETLAEACAFILLLLIASEADVAVGGSVVEVPLDYLSHFNPCSFNPLCVCSTGGRFFRLSTDN